MNEELVVGLVSISDRASTGVYEDKGIPALQEWLSGALTTPWRVETRLIADDRESIENTRQRACRFAGVKGRDHEVPGFGRLDGRTHGLKIAQF